MTLFKQAFLFLEDLSCYADRKMLFGRIRINRMLRRRIPFIFL